MVAANNCGLVGAATFFLGAAAGLASSASNARVPAQARIVRCNVVTASHSFSGFDPNTRRIRALSEHPSIHREAEQPHRQHHPGGQQRRRLGP
jgi:hypothetical protein